MKKLRHAVIGAGRISKKHFAGYAELDNVETIAVCDNDKNLLNKVAETWGIAETTTDYKTILARGDIDFVSICLPNCFHAPVSIDALLAGKHVHCEKPMATDAESAAEMAAVAEKSGKVLMIALNNRFTIYAQYIKNLVNSGWLGDIYFAKCGWLRRNGLPYHGWFSEVKFAGGGALIDLGVHLIDMVMFMMDYPKVDTVSARTYTKFGGDENSQMYAYQNMPIAPGLKFDVEDLAAGMICLKNNASIMFEISWASNIEKEYYFYELYGSKGGLLFRVDVADINMTGGADETTLKLFGAMNGQLVDLKPLVHPNSYPLTEFSHFVDCILTGKTSKIAPTRQGVEMMRIIDAIYKSSETKRQFVF